MRVKTIVVKNVYRLFLLLFLLLFLFFVVVVVYMNININDAREFNMDPFSTRSDLFMSNFSFPLRQCDHTHTQAQNTHTQKGHDDDLCDTHTHQMLRGPLCYSQNHFK
jgi:Ca2+/Na+ antiporter